MTTSCFHLSFSRKSFLRPPWPMTVIPAFTVDDFTSFIWDSRPPWPRSAICSPRDSPGLSSPSIRSLESAQVFAAQILVAFFLRFMTVVSVRQTASDLRPLQPLQAPPSGQFRENRELISLKSVLSPVPIKPATNICSGAAGSGQSQNPDRSAAPFPPTPLSRPRHPADRLASESLFSLASCQLHPPAALLDGCFSDRIADASQTARGSAGYGELDVDNNAATGPDGHGNRSGSAR